MFGIENENVIEEVNNKTGEIYRKQWAFFEQDGQKIPFQFGLGKSAPLKKGEYQLAPRCFATDRYHKLQLNFVALEAVVKSAVRATG